MSAFLAGLGRAASVIFSSPYVKQAAQDILNTVASGAVNKVKNFFGAGEEKK